MLKGGDDNLDRVELIVEGTCLVDGKIGEGEGGILGIFPAIGE